MSMPAKALEDLTTTIMHEIHIKAPIDVTFESLLEQIGPEMVRDDGTPMPMKIEAWPGGRWYRDLGNNNGHLWAHVQAIKKPTLLEFAGPLMLSYAVANNVQYRLSEVKDGTLIKFQHLALGAIPEDHKKGMTGGWKHMLDRAGKAAEARKPKR
jgi:uncharacterized protein YndB with AHSA1/START domain